MYEEDILTSIWKVLEITNGGVVYGSMRCDEMPWHLPCCAWGGSRGSDLYGLGIPVSVLIIMLNSTSNEVKSVCDRSTKAWSILTTSGTTH